MGYLDDYLDDKTLRFLAEDDQSASYEIDITAIYQRLDGTFVLATASGCSCWDGDVDTEDFPTLDALADSIGPMGADRRYNPSPAGALDLVAQARAALGPPA